MIIFWLINCEIGFDLTWVKYCVISEISRTLEVDRANPADAVLTTTTKFQINNAKLYAPVVTLFMNDEIKFLENIKQGFKKNSFLEQI